MLLTTATIWQLKRCEKGKNCEMYSHMYPVIGVEIPSDLVWIYKENVQ